MAMEFSCSHYYTYDEITALLQGWESEYGAVCELSSIGTSLEGRELWLLTGAEDDAPSLRCALFVPRRALRLCPAVPGCSVAVLWPLR